MKRVRGFRPVNRAALWSEIVTSSGRRKMVVDQAHPQGEAARCSVSGEARSVGERGGRWRGRKSAGESQEEKLQSMNHSFCLQYDALPSPQNISSLLDPGFRVNE